MLLPPSSVLQICLPTPLILRFQSRQLISGHSYSNKQIANILKTMVGLSLYTLRVSVNVLTSPTVIFSDLATQKQHTLHSLRTASASLRPGLLTQWNWQKGDVMALFTPNSADIAIITFGTLWAGGVVCPMNNLYTVGELASLLKSSGAKGLTTHLSCLEVAREAALIVGLPLNRIILIGESDPKGRVKHFSSLITEEGGIDGGKKVVINPKEDLAFLVYSSGTTGLPKGVMLSHENIVANILQSCTPDREMLDWKNDSMISFLPMFHIYGEPTRFLLGDLSCFGKMRTHWNKT